jgi:hypothetical protein
MKLAVRKLLERILALGLSMSISYTLRAAGDSQSVEAANPESEEELKCERLQYESARPTWAERS